MAGKLKIILSDLHLGASVINGKRLFNYFNYFTADAEFARLLKRIKKESDQSQKNVELILNGNCFEFLQVPAVNDFDPNTPYPIEAYRTSSAEDSVKRLNVIAHSHPSIFAALTDFMHAEAPVRRITIIKGNHDMHLYWPEVKIRLREIIGATGLRASLLLFAEEFINRENIYVEHGHQYTEQMNTYPNFRLPIDKDNPTQLYYPLGSHFLIHCLQELEADIAWFDIVKPVTTLIWYALKWDFNFAAKLLVCFIKYVSGILDEKTNHRLHSGLNHLMQQLENVTLRQHLARDYATQATIRKNLHQQIQTLMLNARVPDKFHPFSQTEVSADPLEMAQAEQEAAHNSLRHQANRLAKEGKAKVFVFGHTHKPAFERLAQESFYINTGSWLWTPYTSKNGDKKLWQQLLNGPQNTDRFSDRVSSGRPYLPYVSIHYDEAGQPYPQLIDYSGQNPSRETPSVNK